MPPPVIIIPDTTPLIHLAAGDLLHVLPAMGRVVVPDVVALEATRLPDKPWAREIAAWFKAAAVEIASTEIGELYQLAIETGRRPPRNAGEIGILSWLQTNLAKQGANALVVFEDARVPRLIAAEGLGSGVLAVTTLDFLDLAEASGVISSAEAALLTIVERAPTASRMSYRSQREPKP